LVFALLGLVMIWSIFYQFISIFSPRATLTTGSSNLRFGGILDLNWSFTMPQLVKNLEFWLDLDDDDKEATSYSVCVYAVPEKSLAGRGQTSIKLPETSPRPYIQSRKIGYILTMKAKIKYLPDIDQDFRLELSE
jgi:hypothetical protein